MQPGKIIFLNGTSSAGKTTLAHAIQELSDEPILHIALDQFRDGLPDKFRGLNAPLGSAGQRGLNVVPVTGEAKPYTDIRFGDTGKTMLRGMRRAMVAMVETGNHIVIDDILMTEEFLDDYLDVFTPFEVYFVGVRCPKSVINAREVERPGRFPGTAIGHFETCHAHGRYDVEVDSSTQSPRACAAMVLDFMASQPPLAFRDLRALRNSSAAS